MLTRIAFTALMLSLPLIGPAGCSSSVTTPEIMPTYTPTGMIPGCVGTCMYRDNCPADQGPTTLTGTVTIPAGTLPLYNAKVYIPSGSIPTPQASGVSCDRCDAAPMAYTYTTTDYNGQFTLTNVPSGQNIPLVISLGKWQRVITLKQTVADCTTTALDPAQTRLPRNKSEGNIPKIALSTGAADALECLMRSPKLGIDDAEFTNAAGSGRINLFGGGVDLRPMGGTDTRGTNSYQASLNGGAAFPDSSPTWDSKAGFWNQYDIVMLSCEGNQNPTAKSVSARAALLSYINAGGRVFASHWHNYWIAGGPAPLNTVATFVGAGGYANDAAPIMAAINQSQPRPLALANWLQLPAVGGSTQRGQLAVTHSRVSLVSQVTSPTQDWVDFASPAIPAGLANPGSQYFSFNAPIGTPPAMQCGQMVFTDMHLSGAPAGSPGDHSSVSLPFPTGCSTTALSPQEKALIFMLFDLTNCLQPTIG